VEILYRHGVKAVEFNDDGAAVTLEQPDKTERVVSARFVMDCSGYGRVLPRLLQLEKPTNFPVREALFAHVSGDRRPAGREEGKIWACIHPDGAWIWIIPFANGNTSVGAVAEPGFFKAHPAEPAAQLRSILMSDPNVAGRLGEARFLFEPRRISGFACAVHKLAGPRFALVGNATEFLDPIFSSGVTLALGSANCAAKVLTRQLRGEPVDWQTDYVDHVMQGINTFRAYVSAWYDGTLQDIFFAAGSNRDIMKQICSVLAGYVWDRSNPYVSQPERALPLLSSIVQGRAGAPEPAPKPAAAVVSKHG
jgi:flavin-dependent dehydrogenase